MIDFSSLFHNPIIAGGAGLGLAGGLGTSLFAALRSYPHQGWTWVKSRFLVSVDIQNGDHLLWYMKQWLNDHPYTRKARFLTASSGSNLAQPISSSKDDSAKPPPRFVLSPAPGMHLLHHKGKLLWFNYRRDEQANQFGAKPESMSITIIGRKQQVIYDFLNEVVDYCEGQANPMITIFSNWYQDWDQVGTSPLRPMDSIILPPQTKDMVVDDFQKFLTESEWYHGLGIPYQRGYLFYGPPGNGKTSLVTALASFTKRNVYLCSLASKDLDDHALLRLFSQVPANGLLLLEDIDCVFKARKADSKNIKVTFSGLLNAIDGCGARNGQVIVMTTNHKDDLDPALIRPGRIDVQVPFENANWFQACELYQRFHPQQKEEPDLLTPRESFANKYGNGEYSMSHLQMQLLQGEK